MQARFTLDKERARRVRELARVTGATEDEIVTAAIDDAYLRYAVGSPISSNDTPGG